MDKNVIETLIFLTIYDTKQTELKYWENVNKLLNNIEIKSII